MVNRDRTGPEGKGPKTGRGMGPCAIKEPEDEFGLGLRRKGRGLGRGRRFMREMILLKL